MPDGPSQHNLQVIVRRLLRKRVRRRGLKPRGVLKREIGWREWVAMPELGIRRIKAKIDTGARTGALHAWNIVPVRRKGVRWVKFTVHPEQRNNRYSIACKARLKDMRLVRASSGHAERRYVIETVVALGDRLWPIELTLTDRDKMGFRLLLGRASVRGAFLVNPGKSYLMGRPGRTAAKRSRKKTARRRSKES